MLKPVFLCMCKRAREPYRNMYRGRGRGSKMKWFRDGTSPTQLSPKTIQENQSWFKTTVTFILTENISDIFVYWSKNSISQFDKHPVQLNKYTVRCVRTPQVNYSTCEHGNKYRGLYCMKGYALLHFKKSLLFLYA